MLQLAQLEPDDAADREAVRASLPAPQADHDARRVDAVRALALRQKGKPIASAKLLEEACRSYGSATETIYFMDPNTIAKHYMGKIEGARCVGLA